MLAQLLPLTLFMLIPVWIPVTSLTLGALADLAGRAFGRTPAPTPAEQLRRRRAAGAHATTARPERPVVTEAA